MSTPGDRLQRSRERLRALARDLAILDEQPRPSPVAAAIAEALSDAFGGASCVVRPELTLDGWRVGLCAAAGWPALDRDPREELDEHARSAPGLFGGYDPLRPSPGQRNLALRDSDLGPAALGPSALALRKRLGIAGSAQLRMLVCDDAMLLAWVGAFREERFSSAERLMLQSLSPALRARLALDRRMDATVEGAIETAVEAMDAPAFIVNAQHVIAHVNDAGARLVASDRTETLARLASAVAHPGAADGDRVRDLRARGSSAPCRLVVLRAGRVRGAAELEDAARRWLLTPRERDVLALVARGLANKDVATTLGCAVATVEIHVSAILRKAGVDSRAQVVARFWTGE